MGATKLSELKNNCPKASIHYTCSRTCPGNSNFEGKRKTVQGSEGSSYRGRLKKKIICHVAVNTVLIKGKEIQFELAGNSSYPSSS